MPRTEYWTEFHSTWRHAPLAYWVHVEQDGQHWSVAERYEPPAPLPIPHKGYAVLCVPFDEIVLQFSSSEQLLECIRVLSLTPLPTSRQLSNRRGTSNGPNGHWLSRLPARVKSPKNREKLVAALRGVVVSLVFPP
ncbi:hypothetical protein E4L96_10820 [Massilia arenosa]|uniref:Uncharacterized protein n=1 Tax=Zemynaea arenosa TaxID=2561931 RepID=A0A4Y9SC48_9BURK|nr:hypothetical protein [Massilia arenosa]TFW20058.1 hypothetical protein E4L96_10820 [Massilia arenosa]